MSKKSESKLKIFQISFFAIPLAFVGIPIYLNIADFYSQNFSLSLTIIGFLLIFIRGLDAISNPLIGYFSDKIAAKNFSYQKILRAFSLLLCLGFYLVFNPPKSLSPALAATWFTISLSITYLAFNFVSVNFESIIALSAKDDSQRISINSAKEFFGLIGMILAFVIPGIFTQALSLETKQSYLLLSLSFIGLILVANILVKTPKTLFETASSRINFAIIFADKRFLGFLLVFLLNSIAVSLPAANMNFYVRDVLAAEKNIPWALSLYFISAALLIPFWRFLFTKIGLTKSWIISILGSILTFFGAFFLSANSADYFFLVCFLSGTFLGADLIAPPVILAQIANNRREMTSSYFSLWSFVTKIGLMIAASGSLIILGFFDYRPGNPNGSSPYLISFFYAALPCILKSITAFLILRFQKHEN